MSLTAQQKQIEKSIRKQHPGLLSKLPLEKKKQIISLFENSAPAERESLNEIISVTRSEITSSPVPPAELLAGYNAAFPDGADRLFTLVENQAAHRQALELAAVTGNIKLQHRGQLMGLFLALVFGGVGVYFVILGHAVLAGTVLTTTIGGLVATFVLGQRAQDKNLDKKAPK